MIIFREIEALQKKLTLLKRSGSRIGFVPTMGALHAGHLSLITRSLSENTVTVCSIFVNPTQFNDAEDFKKYPVTIDQDILLLEQNLTDILFLPSVSEIYPEGTGSSRVYPLGDLESILEGRYRHGHFQGVCQIVNRLLDIVRPDQVYLGQKDFQQCLVIKKLIAITGRKTNCIIVPTKREASGLAMSSRNLRLTGVEREIARALYQSLLYIRDHLDTSDWNELKETVTTSLLDQGFEKVDYVEIADAERLQPMEKREDCPQLVILIAATLNSVRLIDNLVVSRDGGPQFGL